MGVCERLHNMDNDIEEKIKKTIALNVFLSVFVCEEDSV